MKRTRHRKRRLLKYGLIALLVFAVICAGFFGMRIWDKQQGAFSPVDSDEEAVTLDGKEYVLKDRTEAFLVLGLDKVEGESKSDSYNNDMQSDFLMLLVFDNDKKTVTALQINRDTMVNVNVLGLAGNKVDTAYKQIALAHTYGNGKDVSCHNVAESVSDLLFGMKVNHYMSLTMDAVPVLNDLVGGVKVTVLDDFTGIDKALVKGKTVTLKGEQALRYVRSRRGLEDSTNLNRMERQRQYGESLYEAFKAKASNDDEFIINSSLEMADYIVSDRSITQLQDLAEKFTEYEFLGVKTIEGEAEAGEQYMEFYPNDRLLRKTVIELFYKEK